MDGSARPVVVVGAGLAGLSCALHLQRAGVPCTVLEASDGVGGRVRTDEVEGFRLDRGFQVLLTAYPEARRVLDMDALDLRRFRPGALVRRDGGFHPLGDPFREPGRALSTLRSPVGSLADKLAVPALRWRCGRGTIDDQLEAPDSETAEFLRAAGMGPSIVEGFFRPFLGGVFLDPTLATTSRMFRFVFRMFSQGHAVIPARGMGAIPEQLVQQLEEGTVRLRTEVEGVEPERVHLVGGESIDCEQVVVATDGTTAAGLVGGITRPQWNAVTCLYFEAEEAPVTEPVLILDGDGTGPVNNLCFPTQVSPDYGPADRALVSASVLGSDEDVSGDLTDRVLAQMERWFGTEARSWRHLRTYRIRHALPRQLPGWLDPPHRPVRVRDGVYVAGDHVDTASTNGALGAGRRAAEAVLLDRERR
jgi:phytoene dehydrogenase-like protein